MTESAKSSIPMAFLSDASAMKRTLMVFAHEDRIGTFRGMTMVAPVTLLYMRVR
jgi:hypothetical protein